MHWQQALRLGEKFQQRSVQIIMGTTRAQAFCQGCAGSVAPLPLRPHAQGHPHRPEHPGLRACIGVEHQAQAGPSHCGPGGLPAMTPGHHAHQAEQHGADDVGHARQFDTELGKLAHEMTFVSGVERMDFKNRLTSALTCPRKRKTPLPFR